MPAARRGSGSPDDGFTLAELLVTMVTAVIFFSVFSTIAVRLFAATGEQQARADNLDATRNLVAVLDRQIRYANAINAPLVHNDSQYVTWRVGSTDGSGAPLVSSVQTCHQWRLTPGKQMQHRQWTQGTTTATSWGTVGSGISARSGNVFSISALSAQQNRQQLTLSFTSTHGVDPVTTPNQVSFTALNTRTSTAPAAAVCQEVLPT